MKTKIFLKQFVLCVMVFILAALISPTGSPLVFLPLGLLWVLGAFFSAGLMELDDRTALDYKTHWDKVFMYLALEAILNGVLGLIIVIIIGAIWF